MTELEIALKQRQDKFVETRTIIAAEVAKFLESVKVLPDEVKAKVVLPKGSTPQEILPALWTEPFSMVDYEQQLQLFNTSVQSVTSYCDALNEEAMRCLKLH